MSEFFKTSSKKHLILFFFCLFFAFLSVIFFDRPLAEYLRPLPPLYAYSAKICSFLISPVYPLIFGCVFLILWFTRTKTRALFEITFVQCICSFVTRILKVAIGRPRPDLLWHSELPRNSLSNYFHSFPSGHTMAALALASSLSLLYPRFSFSFFGVAFCLSFSRVLLLKHYLSDLLGTAALALFIAHIVHHCLQSVDFMAYTHKRSK